MLTVFMINVMFVFGAIDICLFGLSIIQEVFHVYLNKFEIAVSHLFLFIFSNHQFAFGYSDLHECAATKKLSLNFMHWIKTVSEDE